MLTDFRRPALFAGLVLFVVRWSDELGRAAGQLAGGPWRVPSPADALGRAGSHGLELAAACLAVLGLAAAGSRAARWAGASAGGLAGGVIGLGAGFGLLSAAWLGLGAAGLLFPGIAAAVLAPLLAFGALDARRLRPPREARPFLLALVLLVPGVLVPEQEVDSLIYHLALPAAYAESHKVFLAPFGFVAGFWQGQEMLHLPALLLGAEPGAKAVSLAAAAGLALCAVPPLRAAAPGWAWPAAALLVLAPPVAEAAARSKNDALAAFLAGAALLALLAGRGRAGRAVPAGLLLGAATACKNTAVIALPALLATCWLPPFRGGWRAAAWTAGAFAVPALPWLARSALELGNPFFPLLLDSWPAPGMGGLDRALIDRHVFSWQVARPEGFVEKAVAFGYVAAGFNALVAAGLLRAVASRKLPAEAAAPALFGGLVLAAWGFTLAWVDRFALPAAMPLTVAAAALLGAGRPAPVSRPLAWALASAAAAAALGSGAWRRSPLPCALGLEPRAAFASRAHGSFARAAAELRGRVPAGARVLAAGDWRKYDPATARALPLVGNSPPYGRGTAWRLAREAADERRLAVKLRQAGATHLLYNLPQSTYWAQHAGAWRWTPRSARVYAAFWDRCAELVWSSPSQDPVNGLFLLFALRRGGTARPARAWLPGTEGEYFTLQRLAETSCRDGRLEDELARLRRAFGGRPEFAAREATIRACRGRHAEAARDFLAAATQVSPAVGSVYRLLGTWRLADLDGESPAGFVQRFNLRHRAVAGVLTANGCPWLMP